MPVPALNAEQQPGYYSRVILNLTRSTREKNKTKGEKLLFALTKRTIEKG